MKLLEIKLLIKVVLFEVEMKLLEIQVADLRLR
jgi:hypothetical protein